MRVRPKPLKLKGINRVPKRQADGTVKIYLYHRATGIRLDPDRLVETYAEAEKRTRRKSEKTLIDLIRLFDTSSTFAALSEESRKQYPWKLKRIEQQWGSVPEDTFNNADDADAFAADALAWHQDLGKTSRRSADNLMSALCRVLSFAKEQRRIKHHPIPTFHRLYKSDRADKTWSEELQQQFIKAARPAMATAMILVRNTAMRAGDVRKFAWTRYDGQRVQIRSSKTGKMLWIPATRELKAHLDALPRTGALVMLTPSGKAYTKRYFNDHWREDSDAVAARDLNFHDNRGTAATLLAEAGATAPEIAEALTWTVDKAQRVIDAYLARRGVLAANAIQKLEDYRDKLSSAT
ncbi:tyrosine-type recombinase/integrase [Bradyrhizobium sp. McL0616]|uniref:tyrosine-type recombinase/integrase n=1 Tax=Bradyrhizobium sp. McL0616 TaxID=3415674 RepID=UPI003CEE129C